MAVADRSRGLVVLLSRQPQFLIPAVMVVLMLVGLLAPLAVALPALVVIGMFVTWLAFLSWPVIDTRQRVVRVVMIAVIALAFVGRTAGWL